VLRGEIKQWIRGYKFCLPCEERDRAPEIEDWAVMWVEMGVAGWKKQREEAVGKKGVGKRKKYMTGKVGKNEK
jgi:hypothetical protein